MLSHRNQSLAVVPAYNEEATVAKVVNDLHRDAPTFDVLVIDDGSTDATRDVARAAGARVLPLPFNVGIGGAVQAGFTYALENGYSYMVQVDGDGQHDPGQIRLLEDAMERDGAVDMVIGSRFLENAEFRSTAMRRVGIRTFAVILSRIVGQRVTDPTSGFRLYNRSAIGVFARDYPHDYPEVEAVLMVHFHKLRMKELPVRMFERGGGKSSINTGKSAYYMIKVLLAIFIGLVRSRPVPAPGDDAPVAAQGNI